MRFKRRDRFQYLDTPRKRAALERKQQAERNALPLFSNLIAAEQKKADEVMRNRADAFAQQESKDRQYRAEKWREGRKKLSQYPVAVRTELLQYWQRNGWPGDPGYLLSMLYMYDTRRLEAVQ